MAVIMDPKPDGLLMLKIMPFVPPYVHLSLRLRLVCKTWNELIVADPCSRTSAPLTSMQCTHATADYGRRMVDAFDECESEFEQIAQRMREHPISIGD